MDGLELFPWRSTSAVGAEECTAQLTGRASRRSVSKDHQSVWSRRRMCIIPPWREASVPAAIEKLRLAARASEAFWLTFRHVGYGPEPGRPRMLWVDCEAGKEIAILRASLLQAYGQTEERPFRPHVTLARIRDNGRRIARRHPIDQGLSFAQRIETVELFQSPPPHDGGISGVRRRCWRAQGTCATPGIFVSCAGRGSTGQRRSWV
jgi:2'-5' RNA ligase